MTLRLHDYLQSGNGYKVRLLLTQLDIPFERIEYDIDRGETRRPAFVENVNPNGRVPVLETEEGEFLPESNAILYYLAEGTPFLSEDRLGRAITLRWMFFEQYSIFSQNTRIRPLCRTDRGSFQRAIDAEQGGRVTRIVELIAEYVDSRKSAQSQLSPALWVCAQAAPAPARAKS
jgi:glutathione S-transferase